LLSFFFPTSVINPELPWMFQISSSSGSIFVSDFKYPIVNHYLQVLHFPTTHKHTNTHTHRQTNKHTDREFVSYFFIVSCALYNQFT
jgi:hypothetical protein